MNTHTRFVKQYVLVFSVAYHANATFLTTKPSNLVASVEKIIPKWSL
jgi:hypothetical protein